MRSNGIADNICLSLFCGCPLPAAGAFAMIGTAASTGVQIAAVWPGVPSPYLRCQG